MVTKRHTFCAGCTVITYLSVIALNADDKSRVVATEKNQSRKVQTAKIFHFVRSGRRGATTAIRRRSALAAAILNGCINFWEDVCRRNTLVNSIILVQLLAKASENEKDTVRHCFEGHGTVVMSALTAAKQQCGAQFKRRPTFFKIAKENPIAMCTSDKALARKKSLHIHKVMDNSKLY